MKGILDPLVSFNSEIVSLITDIFVNKFLNDSIQDLLEHPVSSESFEPISSRVFDFPLCHEEPSKTSAMLLSSHLNKGLFISSLDVFTNWKDSTAFTSSLFKGSEN